jgi:hypothetical protein
LQAHFSIDDPYPVSKSRLRSLKLYLITTCEGGRMPVVHSSLFYVVRRFPRHKDSIHKFFKENEDFKTVCDDYHRCFVALKGWKQSESEEAPARRKEYADLLQELELEISQILNEHS